MTSRLKRALLVGAPLLGAALLLASGAFERVQPFLALLLGALGAVYVLLASRRAERQGLELLRHVLRARRSQKLVRHVVENSFDAIVTVDADGRVESFNPAAERIFGRSAGSVLGRDVVELIAGIGPGLGCLARLGVHEALGCRGDGSVFPLEMSVGELPDEGRPHRVAFVRDITERKAAARELEWRATHDALTGLPNRQLLHRRFEQTIRRAANPPAALVLLDLDGFREVNDTLGHAMGDRLLQEVAARLQGCVGGTGTLARFGGDEFAVLFPDATLEQTRRHTRAMAEALAPSFRIEDLSLHIEAGFGIALYPEHGGCAHTLIQHADVALYTAKRERSGTAVYDPDRDLSGVRQLTLKGDLRHALERGELALDFQPQVSAASGEVVAVEALVRWRHPRLGLIGPAEFIPVAERTGLIHPLTQWVLERAVSQAAAWWHRGRAIRVSVNLSARNLREDDLPERLGALLLLHGLPGAALTLEITESVLMDDAHRGQDVVASLHALGVTIGVDDFGTGYSSLARLRRLPVREIKIDKSFVLGLDRDSSDLCFARSIVDLAHSLGLETVAEGVESEAIWRLLREIGCDSGQGYLFSPPVPAPVLEAWMERRMDARLLRPPAPGAPFYVSG